jgi:hypothetical protein
MKKILPLISISLFFLFGCNQKNSCISGIKAKYINQSKLDGCGWMIQLKNKQNLNAINLGDFENSPKEGQKIWISYEEKPNMFDNCMSGKIIEITCISKR